VQQKKINKNEQRQKNACKYIFLFYGNAVVKERNFDAFTRKRADMP